MGWCWCIWELRFLVALPLSTLSANSQDLSSLSKVFLALGTSLVRKYQPPSTVSLSYFYSCKFFHLFSLLEQGSGRFRSEMFKIALLLFQYFLTIVSWKFKCLSTSHSIMSLLDHCWHKYQLFKEICKLLVRRIS